MGRVYRARHRRVSRRFAVKVLFGDHAADAKMQSRFAREAEAASRLDHPNVISVIDFGETNEGLLYLVMPFVEGQSLASLIQNEAPLPAERIVSIVRQLCQGLAHAHDRGLIHRDFKPENVIVTRGEEGDRPKIVDFGIAMMLESKKGSKLTTEGMVLGTPAVMSPEQAGGESVDHRTDLFALGVVMYEMLSGVLPFEGTPLEIARHNLLSPPPRISHRVSGLVVEPALEEIAHRLMAKQADQRIQTAGEVVYALDQAFAGVFTPVPPTPTPRPFPVPGSGTTPATMPQGPEGRAPRQGSAARQGSPGRGAPGTLLFAAGSAAETVEAPASRLGRKALLVGVLAAVLLGALVAAVLHLGSGGGETAPRAAEAGERDPELTSDEAEQAARGAGADNQGDEGGGGGSEAAIGEEGARPDGGVGAPVNGSQAGAAGEGGAEAGEDAGENDAAEEARDEATKRAKAAERRRERARRMQQRRRRLARERRERRERREQPAEESVAELRGRVAALYLRVSKSVDRSGQKRLQNRFGDIPTPFGVTDRAKLQDIERRVKAIRRQL